MAIIPRLFAVWFNHCCSFAVNAIQTMQSCILSEKFLMLFPKVVGAGGWFAGAMMSSRQAINHDGIDGRLAAAGSPRLHHHAGIIKRIRDVQDVETTRKATPLQPANPFFTLQLAAPYRWRWR